MPLCSSNTGKWSNAWCSWHPYGEWPDKQRHLGKFSVQVKYKLLGEGVYTHKQHIVFVWNSNLIGHPVLAFAEPSKPSLPLSAFSFSNLYSSAFCPASVEHLWSQCCLYIHLCCLDVYMNVCAFICAAVCSGNVCIHLWAFVCVYVWWSSLSQSQTFERHQMKWSLSLYNST
jgi:hypothetical protein